MNKTKQNFRKKKKNIRARELSQWLRTLVFEEDLGSISKQLQGSSQQSAIPLSGDLIPSSEILRHQAYGGKDTHIHRDKVFAHIK